MLGGDTVMVMAVAKHFIGVDISTINSTRDVTGKTYTRILRVSIKYPDLSLHVVPL